MTVAGHANWLLWATILVIFAGTLASRLSFIVLFGFVDEVPTRLERLLEFVPPAALAALVLPGLVYLDGSLALAPDNTRLVAGTVGALVAWRTESLLWTVVVGMAAFWALRFLG